jgi:hypothetical protein
VASSRALFFPPAAFEVFDGEGFILHVQGVFTRIRSRATAMASYGGALGSTIFSTAAVRTCSDSWIDLLGMAVNAWGEKPQGFWLLFISQQRPLQRPDG